VTVVTTRFVLNAGAVSELLNSFEGPVARDLLRRGQRVEDQARVNASGRPGPNVQTGRLRSSIHKRLIRDTQGLACEIGTPVSYARFVEFGTGPTVIFPREKKALYWKGARHPVRYVIRTGNRAYPFLIPALSAAIGSELAQ
jgi:hypothetical protein